MKPVAPEDGSPPAEPCACDTTGSDSAGKLEDSLDDHIRFEECITRLSVRFINLPVGEVDGAIEEYQQLFCEALGLDRSGLFQRFTEDGGAILLTHLYESKATPKVGHLLKKQVDSRLRSNIYWIQTDPDAPDSYVRAATKTFFPWIDKYLLRGEPVIISNLEDLPPEAAQDRNSLARYGTQSTVIMPLWSGGIPFGCLTFASLREQRKWSSLEVKRFRFIADIFANALIRKHADSALRISEERFRQIAETITDFIWEVDSQGLYTYTSPSVEKILGYTPAELVGKVHFYDLFAPDSREDMKAKALEVLAARKPFAKLPATKLGKDGRFVCLERSGVPVLDDAGNLLGYRGADTNVTERKLAEEALKKSLAEIKQLTARLQAESDYLRAEMKVNHPHGQIIGRSHRLRRVLYQVEQVARADCPVLITGETGTGKELIAQEIHRLSARKDRMMVLVNCAALPSTLIESELFGRDRGAYTGALTSQVGRFEVADGSTIFLDEIGDLSVELQAKLLRVLQQGEFQRLGSPRTHKVDVRVIAATNHDLAEAVRKGRFRDDLYYRLKVFPIEAPPLRDRVEDIPMLVSAFLDEFCTRMGKKITTISRKTMELLQAHSWPGNIRELRNVIEHSVILTTGDSLKVTILGGAPTRDHQPVTLAEAEREHILKTLESTGWRIKGPRGAARRLALQPSTLYSRMKKLGIPHLRQKDELGAES